MFSQRVGSFNNLKLVGWFWAAMSMYIFNMLCQHRPMVQGLEPTSSWQHADWARETAKGATAAAWQQCLKHLALLHASGALPCQGHLQATAVNNRQRAWSQNTGGLSTVLRTTSHNTQGTTLQTTEKAAAKQHSGHRRRQWSKPLEALQRNPTKPQWPHHQQHHQTIRQKRWHQHTDSNSIPQHTMATIPHLRSGNKSWQPAWAWWTHFTPTCYDVHQQPRNDSQKQTWEEQHKHWKQTDGYN